MGRDDLGARSHSVVASAVSATRRTWLSPARVRRVIDGDTVEVLLDTGYNQRLVQTIRLIDVDTAEIYGVRHTSDEYARGRVHSRFTAAWLADGMAAADSPDAFPLAVETVKRDKYGGRWDGHIYRHGVWVESSYTQYESLGDALIQAFPAVASPQ